MIRDNREPTPAGIQPTTLKEIEEKRPGEYVFIKADLFEQPHSQENRLLDHPENVPFMFGIGGGLNFLYDMKNGEPEWKNIEWVGNPPVDYVVGNIYFTQGSHIYLKVAENPENQSWVWQKITEPEEQLSWKTGNSDWEYKIYFKPEHRKSAILNNRLNEKGWTYFSVWEDETIDLPEELESAQIEPDFIDGKRKANYIIVDPNRGETRKTVWGNEDENIVQTLEDNGWELVDSNIARGIFVRTKPIQQ
jgi:hypothetical protein